MHSWQFYFQCKKMTTGISIPFIRLLIQIYIYPDHSRLNVFEGFMDFLSALTSFKTDRSGCDTIILNGVGFVKRILDRLPDYHTINLFLDNDKAGLEAAAQIQLIRPDTINRSQNIYPDCKDFNDFLKKR